MIILALHVKLRSSRRFVFMSQGLSKRQIAVLLGLFSLVGPAGLGLGLLAKRSLGGLVEPVLVALTAGTFLYVGATEVRARLAR